MTQLAIQGVPIILDSDDVSVNPKPPDLSRHVVFETKISPLLFMEENQVWQACLTGIDFQYAGARGGLFGGAVYVNVSLVQGTRIGSTRSQLLYRIPGPELPSAAAHVSFTPQDAIPFTTTVDPNASTRQLVEVALTDEAGNPLEVPASNISTVIQIMLQRVG